MRKATADKNAVSQDSAVNRDRILFVLMMLVLMVNPLTAAAAAKQNKEAERQKLLEQYASQSLSRLKNAIKSDGFYNARAALNVWQSNAIEAGTFDEELYNRLKRQIYEKSINNSLMWFEIFLDQKNYQDAGICLQLWRMHASEIGLFDEALYEELKKKLKQ